MVSDDGTLGIGMVGLGIMGREMALHLSAPGSPVRGYDVNPSVWDREELHPLARATSVEDVARSCGVVFLSLPGPKEVDSALSHLVGHMVPPAMVVDTSTIDPAAAKRFDATASEAGAVYCQCPVIGGQSGARQATLTAIVGVAPRGRPVLEPLLPRIAKQIHWVDEPSQAATLKLLNNLVSLGNTLVFSEAFALGARAGVAPERVYSVLRDGSAQSRAMDRRWAVNIQPGDYTPGFTVDLALKDLGLALQYARELSVPLPHGALTEQIYRLLAARGWGKRDVASAVAWWEELLDVTIAGTVS